MAAVLTALSLSSFPAPVVLIVSIIAGILAGMIVGGIPGFFKARLNTNEVIVAIMLNYICTLFTSWLVNGTGQVGRLHCTDRSAPGGRMAGKTDPPDTTYDSAFHPDRGCGSYVHIFMENFCGIPAPCSRRESVGRRNGRHPGEAVHGNGNGFKRRSGSPCGNHGSVRQVPQIYRGLLPVHSDLRGSRWQYSAVIIRQAYCSQHFCSVLWTWAHCV